MASILADYRHHDMETARLLSLCQTLGDLTPVHQKLVGEIIHLRLFSLFENLASSVVSKLACGAPYADGTGPALLQRATSIQNARGLFKTLGRTRPVHQPRWSTASEIKDNIKFVIDPGDNVHRVLDANASLIDEMRRVRNRVAHNNPTSRENYRQVVRSHYGASPNHVTPGLLLVTPRFSPPLVEQYIKKQRIIAKDLVKA